MFRSEYPLPFIGAGTEAPLQHIHTKGSSVDLKGHWGAGGVAALRAKAAHSVARKQVQLSQREDLSACMSNAVEPVAV